MATSLSVRRPMAAGPTEKDAFPSLLCLGAETLIPGSRHVRWRRAAGICGPRPENARAFDQDPGKITGPWHVFGCRLRPSLATAGNSPVTDGRSVMT